MNESRTIRQSGIELLRIIAMAMVVMVHSDFWALGEPSRALCQDETLKAWAQYFVESFAIVCVNCFIFISGWFSIRQSFKGFANLIFQILFYSLLLYFAFVAMGLIPFSVNGLFSHSNFLAYWFLACYIALYLISPILNTFIDNAKPDVARNTVLFFVLLDVALGWYQDYLHFIGGYTLLHFMVIYLIARYIRIYGGKLFTMNKAWDMLIYLTISVLTPVVVMVSFQVAPSLWHRCGKFFLYNSPLVMISSVYFCLFFTKLNMRSKFINFVGASSFAVYLIHADELVSARYMKDFCNSMFIGHDIWYFSLVMAIMIIALFVVAVILDQPRKWLWNGIQKRYFN